MPSFVKPGSAGGPNTALPFSKGRSTPGAATGDSLGDGIGPSRSRSAARTGGVTYKNEGGLGMAEADPNYGAGKAGAS